MSAELNLSFYKGVDEYTDGAVEDELLQIVSKTADFHPVLKNDSRRPVLYHLSDERRNLLEWYQFDNSGSLLEIGAGCGALTGLFTERTARVTAVELSKKRAEIIRTRYQHKANLKICAGNFLDMVFEEKFDYITLIGVLEYTKVFITTPAAYADLFNAVKNVLKPGGRLIVAIENKFGLKYFAGAPEDHTGRVFDSVEGYPVSDGRETFSRNELESVLNNNGFGRTEFYYPYPDYKLPESVFSEDMTPDIYNNLKESDNYDLPRLRLFSERRALGNIGRAGQFRFFANSFLVFAEKG